MSITQIDLPDYDELMSIIDGIGELVEAKESLELQIAIQEAVAFKTCATNEDYFVSGKPPAVAYVTVTYKTTGLDGEIIPMRRNLAVTIARLEVARKRYEILKSRIDVWRTQQATVRALA